MIYLAGTIGNYEFYVTKSKNGNVDPNTGYLHPNGQWSHGYRKDSIFNSRRNMIRAFKKFVGRQTIHSYLLYKLNKQKIKF